MTPVEAEETLRAESAASGPGSLERRFSKSSAKLLEGYRALIRSYGSARSPLIPQSLAFKIADREIRQLVHWVLADFLGWCCFTSACAAFRERGAVNGRFVQALADSICYQLSGREPSTPDAEDLQRWNTWRFAGFAKYTRFPYLFPAMQNSAVWLLSEEVLWLLEDRQPNPLAIPRLTAQVSKLGFDADQTFGEVMLARQRDDQARRKFFAEVDRFAELLPSSG